MMSALKSNMFISGLRYCVIFFMTLFFLEPLMLQSVLKVYVTNAGPEVAVLDAETNTFIKNFTPTFGSLTADVLEGIGISPDFSTAYIADLEKFGVWVVDTINDTAKDFIFLDNPSYPNQVNVLPDGSKVYVSDGVSGLIWVIHTEDNSVSFISGGAAKPAGLAFNPSGSKLYVTDSGSHAGFIYVYQTSDDSFLKTIEGTQASFIAINSLGTGYEPGSSSSDISVFDTGDDILSGTISTSGSDLDGVAFTRDGRKAYVASSSDNTLQVIVDGTLNSSITLEHSPWQVVINPVDNQQVYCTSSSGGAVMVVYADVQVPNANFDANMSNSRYLAYINLLQPPRSLKGRVIKNRFLMQTDIIHRLTWEGSSSTGIVSYRIDRNGTQIANVSAQGPLIYNDHNRSSHGSDFYEVRAINGQGTQSDPASIFVPQLN